jgi:hypothetical protein
VNAFESGILNNAPSVEENDTRFRDYFPREISEPACAWFAINASQTFPVCTPMHAESRLLYYVRHDA